MTQNLILAGALTLNPLSVPAMHQIDSNFSSIPAVQTVSYTSSNNNKTKGRFSTDFDINNEVINIYTVDDNTYDLDVHEKTMGYIRSLLSIRSDLKITQRENIVALIKNIVRIDFHHNLEMSYTDDDEVQFFAIHNNVKIYLLVDEFGGIALNKIGEPGEGYSATYIDSEKIDQRKIIDFAYAFTSN